MDRYYLGTHEPSWLRRAEFAETPFRDEYRNDVSPGIEGALFVSHSRLRGLKSHRPAVVPWALDSMGFSMLKDNGHWTVSPQEYLDAVMLYEDEIGKLEWASPQDWMCEPIIREGGVQGGQTFVGTHLSVEVHQQRTVENFLILTQLYEEQGQRPAPITGIACDWYGESPFMPVLQGFTVTEYLRCAAMYEAAGVHLSHYPLVGVGSVCRRQGTAEIGQVFRELSHLDILMHGFGVKAEGIALYGEYLTSADSMAWSYGARRAAPLPGCTHRNCANCPRYAIAWRDRVIGRLVDAASTDVQLDLFTDAAA